MVRIQSTKKKASKETICSGRISNPTILPKPSCKLILTQLLNTLNLLTSPAELISCNPNSNHPQILRINMSIAKVHH